MAQFIFHLHLLPLRAADIPQDKPVVMYCRSGARSAQACSFMASKGYENMHNLAGGIMAWARSGNAISHSLKRASKYWQFFVLCEAISVAIGAVLV